MSEDRAPNTSASTDQSTSVTATDVGPARRPEQSDRTAPLARARAAALFLAPVAAGTRLDRDTVTTLVAKQVRDHHGVRGVAADVAYEFGEHPDTAPERMRWATATVAALYQRRSPITGSTTVRGRMATR